MKTTAVLLAALLLAAVHADPHKEKEKCVSACQSEILQNAEKDCRPYRSELPRPDLYNHCNTGHGAGRVAACELLCSGGGREHTSRQLDSRRLDACAQFQGRPPSERVSACNDGYVRARARALEATKARRLAQENEPAKPAEPAKAAERATVAKPETPKEDTDVKRKLSLNSQTSPKSVLEAAREEAAAAFQEAKASEL